MKIIRLLYIAAVMIPAITVMTGCSDEDFVTPVNRADERIPVTLSAAYPSVSRASDAGFENGDMMGVYLLDYENDAPQDISGDNMHGSNIRFGFDGTDNSWRGATDLYWKDAKTPADVIAYYPFVTEIVDPKVMPHSISRRQDTASTETVKGGYETSDLLWGKITRQMPTSERIDLTLNHLMSGVRITLKEGDGFAAGEWTSLTKNVLVANIVPSGTVNLTDGTVTAGSDDPISITPMEYNGDYRAVVFPQTIEAGKELVTLSVGSEGYALSRQQPTTYESGKMHTFTVTVDRRDNGDIVFTLTDEAIIPWIDEAEFRDGIMRSYTIIDVPEKGSLEKIVTEAGLAYKEIQNLKLTGEINEADYTFMREKMTSLKSLNIKDVVTFDGERENVIPEKAMYEKEALIRIIFPENLRIIGSHAFHRCGLMGDLIIPEGVEKIGETFDEASSFFVGNNSNGSMGAFSYCNNLLGRLALPTTLTHIEHGAFNFDKFSGLLQLPDNLQFVGACAFNGNSFTDELHLPGNLQYIGHRAFAGNKFTGSIEIPQGIQVIRKETFAYSGFSGTLILPEGVREIQADAFRGCKIRGELLLPSTVLTLGNYAFSGTAISRIVFPEGITSIGKGCFMGCKNVTGKLVIPQNVNRINEYTFADMCRISAIEFHENVNYIGGAAFAGAYNITDIVSKNPTPPLTGIIREVDGYVEAMPIFSDEKTPFYDVLLANVTLKVAPEARDAYSRAQIWKEIGRHATYDGFGCRPEKVCALNGTHDETVIIDGNGEWEVTHQPSWCKVSKGTGSGKSEIMLSIEALSKGAGDRSDYVEFTLKGSGSTARCEVTQRDYQYAEDECVTLQRATSGNGIDVLFIGDCFDADAIADGQYLGMVEEQMEYFFGVEPYSTYRDYFNVYACISLSQETGVNTTSTASNTRFMTRYDNGTGCSVKGLACDDAESVFDYAVTHSPLTREKMPQSLIIMALNSDEYGSVTTLTKAGSAIAIVGRSSDPYPMDSRGILQHEACGHAFGKLAEERITSSRYIKNQEKDEIWYKQSGGWYQNLSLTGNPAEVAWSDMIFDPRYSDKVDIYEGGYGVTRGVFRAEINSCMNYGIPYFSAPARRDIVKRILDYSGEGFTQEKFLAKDTDSWGATGSSRAIGDVRGGGASYHHPVRIVKSKKY